MARCEIKVWWPSTFFWLPFRTYTSCKACVSLAKSPTAHQLHRGPSHPSPSVKESLLFGGFALNCCKPPRFVAFFKQVFIHIINLNHFTYEYLYSCTRRLALFSLGSTCMLYFLLISTSSSFRFLVNYVPHLLQSQLHIGQWQANGHRRAGKA